jgi:hypothetical protein
MAEMLGDEVAWSQAFDDVPYSKPSRPRWELFTAEQWELFDALDAHWDRMERKYGRLMPASAPVLARVSRRIW